MRYAPLVLLACTVALAPGAASAQVAYNAPRAQSGLGGGFVELLLTGRAAPRVERAPVYGADRRLAARPAASSVAPDPYWGTDPFADPAQGRRFAALPADPGGAFLERAPSGEYRRQEVAFDGGEAPGTIVVDTPSKFLYHVLPGGRAMRYGIGVGRPGFEWSGIKSVTMKKEWPDWRPPPEMLRRRPDLPRHMAGGPANPLGARALYLGSSLYRIHGTNEPHTIGQNVSSGCIRMINEDVAHLYGRVAVGTRVKVI